MKVVRWGLGLLALGALIGIALWFARAPRPGGGRCDGREGEAFVASARARVGCDLGTGSCELPPPPICAGAALEEFGALLPAGAACLRPVAAAALAFLEERLQERQRGVRSYRGAERRLDPLRDGDCVADVPSLRAALGRVVDAVASHPLPPNIVVVMTDDQRWDTLSTMPAVSRRLRPRSVDFSESFVTTSLCCPSRASFLSGRRASETGVRGNRPPLGGAPLFDADDTFAVRLREAGYATALLGKYMNGTDLLEAVPPGWDVWQAFVSDSKNYFDYDLNENGAVVHYGGSVSDYSTDLLGRRAADFVTARADGPFFLLYVPFAPHFDRGFFSVTAAPRHVGSFASLDPWRPPSYREADRSGKPPHVRASLDDFWDRLEAAGQQDRLRIEMLESLLAVDEATGALLDRLDEAGLTDHTLFVFTSDNGYQWGEHQLSGKNQAYEESIRVPLLVQFPLLVGAGRRDAHLVVNLDLAPTFLELAGLDVPSDLPGRSLVPLLRDSGPVAWREDFLGEHFTEELGDVSLLFPMSENTFVRSRSWKYVEHEEPFFVELYHLDSDPYELDNKAGDPAHADVANEHARRLRALRSD